MPKTATRSKKTGHKKRPKGVVIAVDSRGGASIKKSTPKRSKAAIRKKVAKKVTKIAASKKNKGRPDIAGALKRSAAKQKPTVVSAGNIKKLANKAHNMKVQKGIADVRSDKLKGIRRSRMFQTKGTGDLKHKLSGGRNPTKGAVGFHKRLNQLKGTRKANSGSTFKKPDSPVKVTAHPNSAQVGKTKGSNLSRKAKIVSRVMKRVLGKSTMKSKLGNAVVKGARLVKHIAKGIGAGIKAGHKQVRANEKVGSAQTKSAFGKAFKTFRKRTIGFQA